MLLLASGIILPNHYSNRVSAASHTNTTGETASLSVSGNINLDLIPTTIGTVGIGKTDVLVTTDSTNGYQILMSGSIGEDGYAPLYGPTLSGEATLNRISSVSSEHVALAANTWGYTLADESNPHQTATQLNSYIGNQYAHGELDTLLFSPIVASPTSPATIATINSPTPTTGDTTSVYVGVKAGGNDAILMKGNYSNSLVFTTIVEPNYHDDGALTITATNSSGITNTVSSTTAGVGGDNLSNSTVSGDIGQTITLVTDYTNAASAVSSSNVHVYLFTGTSWNGSSIANATNPTTPVAECTNITIDPNNTGDNGTSITHPLALTCSVPTSYASTLTNNATYGVAVEVLDTTNTGTNAGQHYFSYWMPGVYTIKTILAPNNGIMQGASCTEFADGEVYSMTDTRDNKKYLVGKLADGNCWMLQNLALAGDTVISNTNSDLNTIASYTLPSSGQAAADRWNSNTNATGYMFNGTHQDATPDTTLAADDVTTANIGAYYSFVVATAGLAPTTASGTAPDSICPRGWKLPTSGESGGQYWTLYEAYDTNLSALITAMKITRTGYCRSTNCPRYSGAFLWSSSIKSVAGGYGVDVAIGPSYSGDKFFGFAVRCVLPSTWAVTYDANGGTSAPAATITPATTNGSQTVTLSTITPTRENYDFRGWATSVNATTAAYVAGANYTITSNNPAVVLYAVWRSKAYMQDTSTGTACLALDAETGETMIAYDRRTEAGYIIGKLKDGKCWMLQNLYLEENPAGTRITLTSTDSDVSSDYTLPASSTTWGSSNTDTTGWFYQGTHKDATVDSAYDAADDEKNTGSYFSYVVATAGLAPTTASGIATDSVCPKNWKLPTGGASGQFQAAYDAYGAYDTFKSAFKAAYTSYCYSRGCPNSYNAANWWSSTIYSATSGYGMHMNSSSFYPQYSSSKYSGFSVRCVFAG